MYTNHVILGCIDKGPLRQFNEQYEDGCFACRCENSGVTECTLKLCPEFDNPGPGCINVVIPPPPGKCCPEQLIDCREYNDINTFK